MYPDGDDRHDNKQQSTKSDFILLIFWFVIVIRDKQCDEMDRSRISPFSSYLITVKQTKHKIAHKHSIRKRRKTKVYIM